MITELKETINKLKTNIQNMDNNTKGKSYADIISKI